MHMIGLNSNNKAYRLWEKKLPNSITNSTEASFTEQKEHDVTTPDDTCDQLRLEEENHTDDNSTHTGQVQVPQHVVATQAPQPNIYRGARQQG